MARFSDGRRAEDSACTTMEEVQDGVSGVNELIGQSALGSEEQSKGITQITLAVAELGSITQHNAVLVQQVSTTVGEILGGVITRFTPPVRAFVVAPPAVHPAGLLIPNTALPDRSRPAELLSVINSTVVRDPDRASSIFAPVRTFLSAHFPMQNLSAVVHVSSARY